MKREREQQEKISSRKFDIGELKVKYLSLFTGRDETGKQITAQKRGYLFEKFIKELFMAHNMEVSEPFKINGEQIDGAIKYDGEHYIMELKWQDCLTANDSLYQFAYKIKGKLYGRGIFISVQGFSKSAIQILTEGKALNMILIDGNDLICVLDKICTLNEMLDNKIRCAQTMGKIYVNAIDSKSKVGIEY